jgi:hypothetical protein
MSGHPTLVPCDDAHCQRIWHLRDSGDPSTGGAGFGVGRCNAQGSRITISPTEHQNAKGVEIVKHYVVGPIRTVTWSVLVLVCMTQMVLSAPPTPAQERCSVDAEVAFERCIHRPIIFGDEGEQLRMCTAARYALLTECLHPSSGGSSGTGGSSASSSSSGGGGRCPVPGAKLGCPVDFRCEGALGACGQCMKCVPLREP